jgi:DNA-binding transcriptional ArsR family regulator
MPDKSKQLLFEKQAEVVKAIAHPLRIAILDFLKDGPRCVCDIAAHTGSERSNVSRHLSVMVAAGVLDCHKDGLKVFYRLRSPCVLRCFSCLTGVLEQQARDSKKLFRALEQVFR